MACIPIHYEGCQDGTAACIKKASCFKIWTYLQEWKKSVIMLLLAGMDVPYESQRV